GGVGVDPELPAQGRPRAGIALRVDAETAAVLDLALPRNDEAAEGVAAHRGMELVEPEEGIDPELAAQRRARAGEPLGVDPPIEEAVLVVALPDDHEIAGGIRRDSGVPLVRGGVGVDPELPAQGCAGAGVALGEHP